LAWTAVTFAAAVRSIALKHGREVRNRPVEINGQRFDIGITLGEGKYGPVQILGIWQAK
jgi:hypothetical protein